MIRIGNRLLETVYFEQVDELSCIRLTNNVVNVEIKISSDYYLSRMTVQRLKKHSPLIEKSRNIETISLRWRRPIYHKHINIIV